LICSVSGLNSPEVRLPVYTMLKIIHIAVFWVLTPCNDVVEYRRFGGPCYFHLCGEVGGSMVLATKLAELHSLRVQSVDTFYWLTDQSIVCEP